MGFFKVMAGCTTNPVKKWGYRILDRAATGGSSSSNSSSNSNRSSSKNSTRK